MTNEQEIERMAEILEQAKIKARSYCGSLNQGYGMWYAKELTTAGIGDKKQAVKEFCDRLRNDLRCDYVNATTPFQSGKNAGVFNALILIEELFTELYGAEE